MKKLQLIIASAPNYYFYTKSRRYLSLIPGQMSRLLAQEGKDPDAPASETGSRQISKLSEEREATVTLAENATSADQESSLYTNRAYYERKLAYLKTYGRVDTTPWEHTMCGITAEDMESSLTNTLQITFEVTDGCNPVMLRVPVFSGMRLCIKDINVLKRFIMEELKLNKVVRLEKRDLNKVKGGNQADCGCGCAEFNGLDNSDESVKDNSKHS